MCLAKLNNGHVSQADINREIESLGDLLFFSGFDLFESKQHKEQILSICPTGVKCVINAGMTKFF